MTQTEWRILGPVATSLRAQLPNLWLSLRNETQFGPQSKDFPYYPAGLEIEVFAREAVHALAREQKAALIREWRSTPRYISVTPDEAILDRYGLVVLDILIRRARVAGSRTSSFE